MLTKSCQAGAIAAVAFAILGLDTPPALSQSLSDVARRETERRKAVASTAKVITNDDLRAVAPAEMPSSQTPAEMAAAPEPAEPTPAPKGPTVTEEDPVTGKVNVKTTAPAREKRDEPYWRARAAEVREKLAKTAADLQAAQANLAALDAAPQTPAIVRERQVAAALAERLQSEVRYRQLDVTKLQMHAEMSKVPPEWIR